MGYMRHHAIIVTSYDEKRLHEAWEKARYTSQEFTLLTSPIVESVTNGYTSFVIVPDGSKEGWNESNKGDEARAHFIDWLETQKFEDGSSPYDWVEVQFGDDDLETKIVNDSDMKRRKELLDERGDGTR